MEVTLAIADVHAIVARTPDRFLVTNAAEHGHAGRRERGIQRPEEAAREPVAAQGRNVVGSNGNPWIDVDGFVLVQAEHVNVFRLDHRLRGNRPGIAVVYSETPTEDMIPVAGQIISEPYARAEVLIVIARLLAHQGRCQGAEG